MLKLWLTYLTQTKWVALWDKTLISCWLLGSKSKDEQKGGYMITLGWETLFCGCSVSLKGEIYF